MLMHSRVQRHWPGVRAWSVVALSTLVLSLQPVRSESVLIDAVEVPVDRVVKNIESRLAATPNDVQLRINLARTHMMAFVLKSSTVSVSRRRETDGPVIDWGQWNILPKEKTTSD